jgi:hypothetical protein
MCWIAMARVTWQAKWAELHGQEELEEKEKEVKWVLQSPSGTHPNDLRTTL